MKYRLHITCAAGHTTYRDYTRRANALKAWKREWMVENGQGWYATSIEAIS